MSAVQLDRDSYYGQVSRLDHGYIEERGGWIDTHLAPAGEPVGLDYCPGNGTSYLLLFVPVRGIEQLGPRNVPAGLAPLDVIRAQGSRWAIVAKVNCTDSDFAFPFDLTPGNHHHVSYIGPHTGLEIADASAFCALLRAICGQQIISREERGGSR